MQQGHGVRVARRSASGRLSAPAAVCSGEPGNGPSAQGETGPRGAIVAGRITPHTPFTDADLDMAETFAGQAAIALELSDARADQQRLGVLVDRDALPVTA